MNTPTTGCVVIVASLIGACSALKPEPPSHSLSALEMYQQLCAGCHGVEGHGDGPRAPSIKTPVPDLTRLAARNGGEFPREDVRLVIDGRSDHPAHGPRDMPVWGWQLYDPRSANDTAARAQTDALIDQLVRYLESNQRL